MEGGVRACELCGSTAFSRLHRKGGHVILRCQSCRLLCLADPPSEKEQREFYDEAYAGLSGSDLYGRYEFYRPALEGTFRRRLLRLRPYFERPGRLLDVGCGPGVFLKEAQEAGWTCSGIDIAPAAVRRARERVQGPVRDGPFARHRFEGEEFDLITMWDVLEHCDRPRQALLDAHALLRPGGLLALTTGDAESWCARLMGPRWHLFRVPEHLFFFSRRTLLALLRQCGFDMLEADYGVRSYFRLDYLARRVADVFRSRALFRFSDWLAEHRTLDPVLPMNLFDILFVAARKRGAPEGEWGIRPMGGKGRGPGRKEDSRPTSP